ncbi:hypothetical protein VTK73DRAFT_10291 [Phialemonium thermophilum]|uniref:Uncharacterized protein n=1 Tax=Phialemonium thermophilum TaxID=223376 RepID=A0ABR3VXG3_9PEZI
MSNKVRLNRGTMSCHFVIPKEDVKVRVRLYPHGYLDDRAAHADAYAEFSVCVCQTATIRALADSISSRSRGHWTVARVEDKDGDEFDAADETVWGALAFQPFRFVMAPPAQPTKQPPGSAPESAAKMPAKGPLIQPRSAVKMPAKGPLIQPRVLIRHDHYQGCNTPRPDTHRASSTTRSDGSPPEAVTTPANRPTSVASRQNEAREAASETCRDSGPPSLAAATTKSVSHPWLKTNKGPRGHSKSKSIGGGGTTPSLPHASPSASDDESYDFSWGESQPSPTDHIRTVVTAKRSARSSPAVRVSACPPVPRAVQSSPAGRRAQSAMPPVHPESAAGEPQRETNPAATAYPWGPEKGTSRAGDEIDLTGPDLDSHQNGATGQPPPPSPQVVSSRYLPLSSPIVYPSSSPRETLPSASPSPATALPRVTKTAAPATAPTPMRTGPAQMGPKSIPRTPDPKPRKRSFSLPTATPCMVDLTELSDSDDSVEIIPSSVASTQRSTAARPAASATERPGIDRRRPATPAAALPKPPTTSSHRRRWTCTTTADPPRHIRRRGGKTTPAESPPRPG